MRVTVVSSNVSVSSTQQRKVKQKNFVWMLTVLHTAAQGAQPSERVASLAAQAKAAAAA